MLTWRCASLNHNPGQETDYDIDPNQCSVDSFVTVTRTIILCHLNVGFGSVALTHELAVHPKMDQNISQNLVGGLPCSMPHGMDGS